MSSVNGGGNAGGSPLWDFGRWLLAGTATNALTGPDNRLGTLITIGGTIREILKQRPTAGEMTDAVGGEGRAHTAENWLSGAIEGVGGIVSSLFGEEGNKKFQAMREDVMSEGGLDRIKEKVLGQDGLSSDNGKLVRYGAIGLGVYFGAKMLSGLARRIFSGPGYMYDQMMPQFAGGGGWGGGGFDPRTALADPRMQMAMTGVPGGWNGPFG